jgi:hypothetical protein
MNWTHVVGELANQRQRDRHARGADEVAKLEAEVCSAESRIEQGDGRPGPHRLLGAAGVKLKAEEAKLLDARQKLTQARSTSKPAPMPEAYSPATVLAVLRHLEAAASKRPQKAKVLVRRFVDGVLMTPTPPATW